MLRTVNEAVWFLPLMGTLWEQAQLCSPFLRELSLWSGQVSLKTKERQSHNAFSDLGLPLPILAQCNTWLSSTRELSSSWERNELLEKQVRYCEFWVWEMDSWKLGERLSWTSFDIHSSLSSTGELSLVWKREAEVCICQMAFFSLCFCDFFFFLISGQSTSGLCHMAFTLVTVSILTMFSLAQLKNVAILRSSFSLINRTFKVVAARCSDIYL